MTHLKRILLIAFLMLATPGAGCIDAVTRGELSVRDARLTANIAARSLAATQATAELLYEFEQRMVVEKAKREAGITKHEIRERLAKVRERWAPLKALFPRARAAHAKLAKAFEDGVSAIEIAGLAVEFAALDAQIAAGLDAARERMGVGEP